MKEARARSLTIALLVALAVLSVWNALNYPPGGGYDAIDHIAYAEGIRQGEGVPEGVGEYYTPPGFYTLAAGAIELGDRIGLGDSQRLVQLLNAFLACSTALLLLALGRELWPGRHVLHVAALGFFVCSPLVLKTTAMFHPETLDLCLSTLALLLAARMIVRDDYRLVLGLTLGAVLGAGQLVRAFSLWTFAVVVLALAARSARRYGSATKDPRCNLGRVGGDCGRGRSLVRPPVEHIREPDLRPATGPEVALGAPAGRVLR